MQTKGFSKILKSAARLILEFLPIFVLISLYLSYMVCFHKSSYSDNNSLIIKIMNSSIMALILLLSQLFAYSFSFNIILLSATVISLVTSLEMGKIKKMNSGKGPKQVIIKAIAALIVFYVVCSWFSAKIWLDQCNNELKLRTKVFPRVCVFYEEQSFAGSESNCYAKIILNKEETKQFLNDNKAARLVPPNITSFNDIPLGKLFGWNPKSGKDTISGQMTFEGRGFIQYYIDQSHKKKDILYLMYWIY